MLLMFFLDSQGLKILATPPSVVHVGDGETVVLECAASDNPLPQISWVNGGKIVFLDCTVAVLGIAPNFCVRLNGSFF